MLGDKLCVRTKSDSEKYLYLSLKDIGNLVYFQELNAVSVIEMNWYKSIGCCFFISCENTFLSLLSIICLITL